MLAPMQALFAEWKDVQDRAGKFYLTPNHRCTGKACQFYTLPLFRAQPAGAPGALTLSRTRTPVSPADAAIVVCTTTGTPHYCGGALCRETIDTESGDRVCRLTGTVLAQHREAVGRFGSVESTLPSAYVPRQVREMTTETMFERAVDLPASTKFPRPGDKRSFLAQVLVLVTSIFSRERFDAEYALHVAHTEVIRAEIQRYITRCGTKQELPDIIRLTCIVVGMRRRLPPPVSLRLRPEPLKRLSAGYASLVAVLWHLLRTRVRDAGKSIATVTSLREFTLAALEMCQTGFSVVSRDGAYRVEIVPRDPVMQMVPVSTVVQEIVLGKAKNLSRMRKGIREALQRAVDEQGVNPEELRVGAYEFDGLPETAFVGL